MLILSEDNAGQVFVAEVGDEILLVLKEAPSTGYSWKLKTQPKHLKLLVDDFLNDDPALKDHVGGQRYRYWRFRVTGNLHNSLELIYEREWQKGNPDDLAVKFILSN